MNRKTTMFFAVIGASLVASTAWADSPAWGWAARWGWLPGTLFGVLAGLWGGISGSLAPRGRARKLVMAWGLVLLAACAAMLLCAVVLLVMGHPWWSWYPWLLPGGIGVPVLRPLLRTVRLRYQQAEMRRLEAKDVSSQQS